MANDITNPNWRNLNDRIAEFEESCNGLQDQNFANYAQITPTKFNKGIVVGDNVAGTSPAQILRLDQYGNWRPPLTVGNKNQFECMTIYPSYGSLQFVANAIPSIYVNTTGWHTGVCDQSTTTCKTASIEFDSCSSYWIVMIDGVARAYIDGLAINSFVNTVPGGTRTKSQGASLQFNDTTHTLDFRNNGLIVAQISSSVFGGWSSGIWGSFAWGN